MTWLPVDHAASVITDLVHAGLHEENDSIWDPDLVYHVLNPIRFHWSRDMLPALANAGLVFEKLPTAEWMERLRKSDRDPVKNPPIKLLDWFEGKYGTGAAKTSAEIGRLEYLTSETQKDSESLRHVPDVTAVPYVRMMVDQLKAHWKA